MPERLRKAVRLEALTQIAKAMQHARGARKLDLPPEDDALIFRDRRGITIAANPEACRILGKSEAQLVGLPPCKLIVNYLPNGNLASPEDAPSMVAMRHGRMACGVFGIGRAGMDHAWVFVEAQPIFDMGVLARFRPIAFPFPVFATQRLPMAREQ